MSDDSLYIRAAETLLDRYHRTGEFEDLLAAETCLGQAVKFLALRPVRVATPGSTVIWDLQWRSE